MRVSFAVLFLAAAGLSPAASLPSTGGHRVAYSGLVSFESGTGRTVRLGVWQPAERVESPLPLVLFSPGFGNQPSQYLSQLEDLASHGYVVVGVEHPADTLHSFEERAGLWARDIVAARDSVLRTPLRKRIDSTRIGVFGHSLGGRAAAGACLLDSAIRGCLNEDGGADDVQLKRPYWPVAGREFAGMFAYVDWFDPGIEDDDLRAMGKTRAQYAASRLDATPAALQVYRAARGGALRITMLTPGMRHTAFTDDPYSSASSDAQRARFAGYLRQVREIVLRFFEVALRGQSLDCRSPDEGTYVQCFPPTLHDERRD